MKKLAATPEASNCLNVEQLASKLGISKHKAWQLIWGREIDFARIGRRVIIPGSAYEKYLEKHTVKAVK